MYKRDAMGIMCVGNVDSFRHLSDRTGIYETLCRNKNLLRVSTGKSETF